MNSARIGPPDVLICDVGDTLIRWTGYDRRAGLESLAPLCDRPDRLDVDRLEQASIAFDADIEPRSADKLIEHRQSDFLRSLFARFGMQLSPGDDELDRWYWEHSLTFVPEEGVKAALKRLRDAGIRLAIVSNTVFGPEAIAFELGRHHLADFFDRPIVTSARFVTRKPHPSIIQAAKGLHTNSDETAWYIGNSVYHDVGGAVAAGMPVVWYNNDEEPQSVLDEHGVRPTIEVRTWAELADRWAPGAVSSSLSGSA